LFEIKGKIFLINKVSDKSAQIVLCKNIRGKNVLIIISIFGIWKKKFEEKGIKKNDTISGTVYSDAKLYNGKWYNDLYFNEVIKKQPRNRNRKMDVQDLFSDGGIGNNYIVDEETGEILL